jgi:hypothetical protein
MQTWPIAQHWLLQPTCPLGQQTPALHDWFGVHVTEPQI